MKTILTLLIVLLTNNFVANVAADEFDASAIESEILKRFEELVAVSKSLDVDKYLEFFDAEKFTALNENGTVTHRFSAFSQNIRRNFAGFKGYKTIEFTNVKVAVLDANTAILVNEFQATVILNNNNEISVGGAGTQVWQKAEGQWLLVNVSSSPKPINTP